MFLTIQMLRVGGITALVIVLAIAGCGSGGSDGSETEAEPTVTKAHFLKRAEAICAQGKKEAAKLEAAAWKRFDPDRKNASEATENKVSLAFLSAREEELRRLRAVGLPKGSAEYVDTMLQAWEKGIEKGREHPRLLRAGGPEFAFYKAYSMGNDYGLESCWLD
jgi:hypothetical protein